MGIDLLIRFFQTARKKIFLPLIKQKKLIFCKEIRKKLIAIGYQPKIKVNASGMHQVIIDETNSLTAGNKISDDLKNKGIKKRGIWQ